jgi:hypothetical protein
MSQEHLMFTKLSEKEMPKNIPLTYLFTIFVLFFSIKSYSQVAVLEEEVYSFDLPVHHICSVFSINSYRQVAVLEEEVVIEEASELSLEEALIIVVMEGLLRLERKYSLWALKMFVTVRK